MGHSDAVSKAKKRYDVGLQKLEFATQQVNQMQKELEDLQPVLASSQAETDQLMKVLSYHSSVPPLGQASVCLIHWTGGWGHACR